jgi:bacterioferritin-associated ferredoxin
MDVGPQCANCVRAAEARIHDEYTAHPSQPEPVVRNQHRR